MDEQRERLKERTAATRNRLIELVTPPVREKGEGFCLLDELTSLYDIQRARINVAVAREVLHQTSYERERYEIKLALDILSEIRKATPPPGG